MTRKAPGREQPSRTARIAVVVPCYRVTERVLDVIVAIPEQVALIVCVDDGCPDGSGDRIERSSSDPRVVVLRHAENQGVGGAVLTGYRYALRRGADIIVKVDGDGQMDPRLIPRFTAPIASGEADYTKGNRFFASNTTSGMPLARKLGNALLSFATKASSGYWQIFDPTNGYTAIHSRIALLLPFERIAMRYFFESDMLFHLGLIRARVEDVPMLANYGEEVSQLRVRRVWPSFVWGNLRNTLRRLGTMYLVRDFSVASVELIAGAALLCFGLVYGTVTWLGNLGSDAPAPAGVVMIAAVPIILGLQLLLSFVTLDVVSAPSRALHPRLAELEVEVAARRDPARVVDVQYGDVPQAQPRSAVD